MEKLRVVFDCMIFLQAVLSKKSVAFRLFEVLEKKAFELFLNQEILDEVLEVLSRQQFRVKYSQITDERVEDFLNRVLKKAVYFKTVTPKFMFPRDPKDEKYINLAIEAEADFIVSFDKDLLDLMTGIDNESKEFRQRFRKIKVVTPHEFIERVKL